MSRPGRKLTPEEAEVWARVAKTVVPLREAPPAEIDEKPETGGAHIGFKPAASAKPPTRASAPQFPSIPPARPAANPERHGLDSTWNRKLARGLAEPDFTLDLHGCTLDQAHARLIHGLAQAKAMGARLVLLVTGKARPVDAADRGARRGAIRAKVIDWLAASEHALDIAAIRGAHRRHGGPGALYIVLKRRR
jgi:DNA-nicking Smr family endonuclease